MHASVNTETAKYAPKILMSGGYDREDNVSEAETMKKIALEKGVPSKDIILKKQPHLHMKILPTLNRFLIRII